MENSSFNKILIVFCGLLSACTSMNEGMPRVRGITSYVTDFPVLEQKVTLLPFTEVLAKCDRHKPESKMSEDVLACSEINFRKGTCEIFIAPGSEPWVLKHEQAHCRGGDHDKIVSTAFERWKSSQKTKEIKK